MLSHSPEPTQRDYEAYNVEEQMLMTPENSSNLAVDCLPMWPAHPHFGSTLYWRRRCNTLIKAIASQHKHEAFTNQPPPWVTSGSVNLHPLHLSHVTALQLKSLGWHIPYLLHDLDVPLPVSLVLPLPPFPFVHSDTRLTMTRAKSASQLALSALSMLSVVSIAYYISQRPYRGRLRIKPTNLRKGWTFYKINVFYNDHEFGKAYRMSRQTFKKLLFIVRSRLKKNEEMGRRAGRETLTPEVRLGILLRMMAGDSVWSCMSTFRVGRSTVFHVFLETKDILNDVISLPGLPNSFTGLKKLADDFQCSRSPPSPLPGCVGALDGISIRIRKPRNYEHPATFYCRKGYYAIPVQALVDANYRFLCVSAICRGSTHDSLAHAFSELGRFLDREGLRKEFWIAGDEAYVCTEFLTVAVPASQASDIEDGFNIYLSSLRMHVEQAFVMLVKKWAILKRLEYSVDNSAQIVGLAMKLDNFCVEHGDRSSGKYRTVIECRREKEMLEASEDWYEEGKHNHFETVARRGSGTSKKRDMLVKIIADGNNWRPPVVPTTIPFSARGRLAD